MPPNEDHHLFSGLYAAVAEQFTTIAFAPVLVFGFKA
jgi:hypothetical protein